MLSCRPCELEWHKYIRLVLTIATVAKTFIMTQIDMYVVKDLLSVFSESGSKTCPISMSFSLDEVGAGEDL